MDKRKVGFLGALLALVLFFAVNVAAGAGLRSMRFDLTEQKLFTLSDGSKRIVEHLEEPIRLRLYVSAEVARNLPFVKDYANRVRDVLEEFAAHSHGDLALEIVDPEPFSEEEERAVRDGVAGIPLTEKDTLYFGLVGTGPTSEKPEVIPFFGDVSTGSLDFDKKERFLEYDIARLIYTLSHPNKKKVGVLSSLPLQGGAPEMPYSRQQPTARWKILDQIDQFFETTAVDAHAEELPKDLDALVLVHPRDLPPKMLFAIDQFVLGGGKLLAFVDPHCEADESGQDPSDPMSRFRNSSKGSDLNQLFQAWGFEMVPNKIAGDRTFAAKVQVPSARGQGIEVVPYVVWLDLQAENTAKDDPVTSLLTRIVMKSPGILRATEGATTKVEPLLHTSEESMEIDANRLQFMPDPQGMLREFVPAYQTLTLAARISGEAKSAFPDGPPKAGEAPQEENGEPKPEEPAPAGALTASKGPIHVIAVADADMLADDTWIREQRLGPISLGYSKLADNADFLVGAIENLLGGEELTSIRARGRFQRPFEKVDRMRTLASQRFQSEESELQSRLNETQRHIDDLQREKKPGEDLILSPEQAAELTKAQDDLLATKRRLREVKHDLNQDIERYGTQLKLINIGLIPLILSVAAVGLFAWRVQRRGKA